MYYRKAISSASVRDAFFPLTRLFENKYYLDRIYEDLFVRLIFQRGWNRLMELIDVRLVDGAVNGSATVTRFISGRLRLAQTGQLQSYGLAIIAGILILVFAVFTANPL
jgi:NADH-quinone oxidoreductase subunit L